MRSDAIVVGVNKVHYPVTALGYGRRVGVWLQGCSIRCEGCVNRDTWEPDPSKMLSVGALLSACQPWLAKADGVTISGGEPFDQPGALGALIAGFRMRTKGDLLVFSGYSLERLQNDHGDLLSLLDVLISDPFDATASQTLELRGSDNQRVSVYSDLARQRYPADINERRWPSNLRPLDAVVAGGNVWMAGIPDRRLLVRLRAAAAARGVAILTSDQPAPKIDS